MLQKTAIIVGKFQVPTLCDYHKELISTAVKECRNIVFVLHSSRISYTRRYPLPFDIRKEIILRYWRTLPAADRGHIDFCLIDEFKDAYLFFRELDAKIKNWKMPNSDAIIYYGGSDKELYRDYNGTFETRDVGFLPSNETAREVRNKFSREDFKSDVMFAYGILSTVANTQALTHQYLIPVVLDSNKNVLLLKNKSESKWGFLRIPVIDPDDKLEVWGATKWKEFFIEGTIKSGSYEFSYLADDWRYRYCDRKPLYFVLKYELNTPWIGHSGLIDRPEFKDVTQILMDDIEEEYHPIVHKLKVYCQCPL